MDVCQKIAELIKRIEGHVFFNISIDTDLAELLVSVTALNLKQSLILCSEHIISRFTKINTISSFRDVLNSTENIINYLLRFKNILILYLKRECSVEDQSMNIILHILKINHLNCRTVFIGIHLKNLRSYSRWFKAAYFDFSSSPEYEIHNCETRTLFISEKFLNDKIADYLNRNASVLKKKVVIFCPTRRAAESLARDLSIKLNSHITYPKTSSVLCQPERKISVPNLKIRSNKNSKIKKFIEIKDEVPKHKTSESEQFNIVYLHAGLSESVIKQIISHDPNIICITPLILALSDIRAEYLIFRGMSRYKYGFEDIPEYELIEYISHLRPLKIVIFCSKNNQKYTDVLRNGQDIEFNTAQLMSYSIANLIHRKSIKKLSEDLKEVYQSKINYFNLDNSNNLPSKHDFTDSTRLKHYLTQDKDYEVALNIPASERSDLNFLSNSKRMNEDVIHTLKFKLLFDEVPLFNLQLFRFTKFNYQVFNALYELEGDIYQIIIKVANLIENKMILEWKERKMLIRAFPSLKECKSSIPFVIMSYITRISEDYSKWASQIDEFFDYIQVAMLIERRSYSQTLLLLSMLYCSISSRFSFEDNLDLPSILYFSNSAFQISNSLFSCKIVLQTKKIQIIFREKLNVTSDIIVPSIEVEPFKSPINDESMNNHDGFDRNNFDYTDKTASLKGNEEFTSMVEQNSNPNSQELVQKSRFFVFVITSNKIIDYKIGFLQDQMEFDLKRAVKHYDICIISEASYNCSIFCMLDTDKPMLFINRHYHCGPIASKIVKVKQSQFKISPLR